MFYLTKDMARAAEAARPYTDLKTYAIYKQRGLQLTPEAAARIESLDTGPVQEENE